jgi:hypothetical protein
VVSRSVVSLIRWISAAVAPSVILVGLHATSQQGWSERLDSTSVPKEVLAAADAQPEQFAQALLHAGVPSAIVIVESEPPSGPPTPNWAASEGPGFVKLGDVLTRFRNAHAGLPIVERDGVLAIEAAHPEKCRTTLRRSVESFSFQGNARWATRAAVRRIRGDAVPGPEPALVGSQPDPHGERFAYDQQVALHLFNVTIVDIMDALVRQVQGVGWALRERHFAPVRSGSGEADHPGYTRSRNQCLVELYTAGSWLGTSLDLLEPVK